MSEFGDSGRGRRGAWGRESRLRGDGVGQEKTTQKKLKKKSYETKIEREREREE